MPNNKMRVLIADDNLIDREGVQRILEREDDMDVIDVAKTPPEVVEMTRALQPDVLILDLKWPPDILVIQTLIEKVKSECPETAILGLTAYPRYHQAAHNAGIWMINKDVSKDVLIETVRAVYSEKRKINLKTLHEAQEAMIRIEKRLLGKDNSNHENDISIVLDAVFKPHLSNPRLQSRTRDGVQRRDIVFSNTSDSGFWHRMRQQFDADQIVFEVKNVTDVDEDYFRQIASYLTPSIGRLGFLVTRNPIPKGSMAHIVAVFHHEKKLIMCLCDEDLAGMIILKESGRDPTTTLQRYYDELITLP